MIVAQISDIHAAPDNDNLSRFDQALAWLDFIELDVLVITGDVIEENWREGYERVASRLKDKIYPTLFLPGNSDDKAAMRALLNLPVSCDDMQALHFVCDIKGLRLIGLDTAQQGLASGRVAEHLPWLEDKLSAEGVTASMLFLHHHVFPSGIAPMDEIMCLDAGRLEAFLRTHSRPPVAISTGHVHRPVLSCFAAIPASICGSICPANPAWLGSVTVPPVNDPPSLMLHHFHNGNIVSHVVNV